MQQKVFQMCKLYREVGACTDQPKSATFSSPLIPSSRFSGLMSLWITFLEWQYCRASASWYTYCNQSNTTTVPDCTGATHKYNQIPSKKKKAQKLLNSRWQSEHLEIWHISWVPYKVLPEEHTPVWDKCASHRRSSHRVAVCSRAWNNITPDLKPLPMVLAYFWTKASNTPEVTLNFYFSSKLVFYTCPL